MIKIVIFILLLSSCSTLKPTFKIGDCALQEDDEHNRMLRIMEITKKSYVAEVISQSKKSTRNQWQPLIYSKHGGLLPIDCFIGHDKKIDKKSEIYRKWEKSIKKLRKKYGKDK